MTDGVYVVVNGVEYLGVKVQDAWGAPNRCHSCDFCDCWQGGCIACGYVRDICSRLGGYVWKRMASVVEPWPVPPSQGLRWEACKAKPDTSDIYLVVSSTWNEKQ